MYWWAQDGAPAHRTVEISEFLTELFQNRIIALDHPTEWPPRSPDLTPCDYFLWGYQKSKVFRTPPVSIADLRARIIHEANLLKQDRNLVRRAVRDMIKRANTCIDRNGGHVEGKYRWEKLKIFVKLAKICVNGISEDCYRYLSYLKFLA